MMMRCVVAGHAAAMAWAGRPGRQVHQEGRQGTASGCTRGQGTTSDSHPQHPGWLTLCLPLRATHSSRRRLEMSSSRSTDAPSLRWRYRRRYSDEVMATMQRGRGMGGRGLCVCVAAKPRTAPSQAPDAGAWHARPELRRRMQAPTPTTLLARVLATCLPATQTCGAPPGAAGRAAAQPCYSAGGVCIAVQPAVAHCPPPPRGPPRGLLHAPRTQKQMLPMPAAYRRQRRLA